MVNNVSFNQLYNLEQNNSKSASAAANSFSGVFADTMGINSDPFSSDLSSSLMASSSGSSVMLMSLIKNGVSSDMIRVLFSMLGSGLSGGAQGYTQSSSQSSLSSGLQGTLQNSLSALPSISLGGVEGVAGYNDKSGSIPYAASVASHPSVTSTASNRNPALYRQVINQFNVETNPRYEVNKKGRGDTYCNIFLWDVTRAMGAEIPHYVNPTTREPVYYPNTQGAREMNANATYDWLEDMGSQYGWKEVSAQQAQLLANQGHPVVTAKKNPTGHGHVQVVCPSNDGGYDPSKGVTVAQAGSRLTNYSHMSSLYRTGNPPFKYYVHA